jgi:hypothetical protein
LQTVPAAGTLTSIALAVAMSISSACGRLPLFAEAAPYDRCPVVATGRARKSPKGTDPALLNAVEIDAISKATVALRPAVLLYERNTSAAARSRLAFARAFTI